MTYLALITTLIYLNSKKVESNVIGLLILIGLSFVSGINLLIAIFMMLSLIIKGGGKNEQENKN